jgi:hypothetical protein
MRTRYRFVPPYKARRQRGFFLDLEKPSYQIRRKVREEIEKSQREMEAILSARSTRPSLLKRLGDWFRGA